MASLQQQSQLYIFYKKNWDTIRASYKTKESGRKKLTDYGKRIGEINAYHNLLITAVKEYNMSLFVAVWNAAKDTHLSYIKIHKFFKMVCAYGDIEICNFIISNSKSINKFFSNFATVSSYDVSKTIPKDVFAQLVTMYINAKPLYNRDALVFILDKLETYDDIDLIDQTNCKFVDLYLNLGLFQDSKYFKRLSFKHLFFNLKIQSQLTPKTIFEYIASNADVQDDSEIKTILNMTTIRPDEAMLTNTLSKFVEKNNLPIVVLLFDAFDDLIKKYGNDKITQKLINTAGVNIKVGQIDPIMVFLFKRHNDILPLSILETITSKSQHDNLFGTVDTILNKYNTINFKPETKSVDQIITNLSNNCNYRTFRLVYDKWGHIMKQNSNPELNKIMSQIIRNLIKAQDQCIGTGIPQTTTLDYIFEKYNINQNTFNEIIADTLANNGNKIGLRYILTKYANNNELRIDLKHNSFSGYSSSYYRNDSSIYESILIKILKFNDFELVNLFLAKSTSQESCPQNNMMIIKAMLKSKVLNREYMQLLLKGITDIYPLADELLQLCCASDDMFEINKLLVETYGDIYACVVIDDMFDIACKNNAINTAKWLLSMYPDIDITRNDNRIFKLCCNSDRIMICKLLKKICPWYALVIVDGRVVYSNTFRQDYVMSQIEKINDGHIANVLAKLNIKTVDSLIEPNNECYICKDNHPNILRLPCGHYYCLVSLFGFWKNAKNPFVCCYCKKDFKFSGCVNYSNPVVDDDDLG